MTDHERKRRLLSRAEAAHYLNMSLRSFDRLRLQLPIPFVRLGRRKKYLLPDLEAVIAENRTVEEPRK